MIIDLNRSQVNAIQDAFGWGDNSCFDGYIDTETNECVLFGCMCPYTNKLPSDKVLVESDNGWEIRDNKDYFNYGV